MKPKPSHMAHDSTKGGSHLSGPSRPSLPKATACQKRCQRRKKKKQARSLNLQVEEPDSALSEGEIPERCQEAHRGPKNQEKVPLQLEAEEYDSDVYPPSSSVEADYESDSSESEVER